MSCSHGLLYVELVAKLLGGRVKPILAPLSLSPSTLFRLLSDPIPDIPDCLTSPPGPHLASTCSD